MQSWKASRPILIIVGCSDAALSEFMRADLMTDLRCNACSINRMAEVLTGTIAYSFHAELLVNKYSIAPHIHLASCNAHPGVNHYPLPRAKRKGSSALQAAWLAMECWGYDGVIFAGVALGDADCFGGTANYSFFRKHWPAFATIHGERCRAMSGYTAELFGTPDPEWVKQMLKEK